MSFLLQNLRRKSLFGRWIRVNIVAASSYSSQLGFVVAHAYASRATDLVWLDLFVVVIKPLPADPTCSMGLISSELLKAQCGGRTSLLCVLPVASFVNRCAAYLLLLVAWILTPLCTVRFWQPRIHWLDKPSLKLGQSSFSIRLPALQQVLYGDGFMQYCMTDRPFWLAKTEADLGSVSGSVRSVVAAFYHFSLQPVPAGAVNAQHVNRSFVFERFRVLLDGLPASAPLHSFLQGFTSFVAGSGKTRLFFLPTTTFYETGRATLAAEMAMYREYVAALDLPSDALIICKPHPTSAPSKLSALAELSAGFSAAGWIGDPDGALSLAHFSLVPLELLLFMLISYQSIVKEACIGLAVASTASLSCLSLFPSMLWRAAFGDALVHRYLNPDFALTRLRQEGMINSFLANHSSQGAIVP